MHVSLAKLFQSQRFKKFTLTAGIIFFIMTFLVSLDPRPFLRFGYLGVFVFSLFGPGSLLIFPLSAHMNIFLLSFITAMGMAFNDSVTWVVGRSGDIVLPRTGKIEKLEANVKKFGSIALFFWSLVPFPYDIVGFIAGYLEFSYRSFIIPTFLGKFIRFILMGAGAIWFGQSF